MGATASTSSKTGGSAEQKEAENLVASTGALPFLQKAFSNLADPQTKTVPLNNLKQCFSFNYVAPICESPKMPDSFPILLEHLGSTIADQFFLCGKEGISWVEFLRGYSKRGGQNSASASLNMLLRVFVATSNKANVAINFEFDDADDAECKITGSLEPNNVLMLLWICWSMSYTGQSLKLPEEKQILNLPDISDLVFSAIASCAENGNEINVCDTDISSLQIQMPIGKLLTWIMMTIPSLPNCLPHFIHSRLQASTATEDKSGASTVSAAYDSITVSSGSNLLTPGRAWAISLNVRGIISEEILRSFFLGSRDQLDQRLLYRSSIHGRGLNRFCSNIEGYKGPVLTLIAASSSDANEERSPSRKWIVGALLPDGFVNKDRFYGSSGFLYAMSPVFHAFPSTGKEKNFVYFHLHPTGRVYEPKKKPVGIAFGGTLGNERIFVDEDFAKITIRHHVVDKTYRPGPLFPHQGFSTVEASINEVEVWGFGGQGAKELQNAYKRREEIFTEQRRKVDMKKFANWEESPEKMMMDMMSNPNTVCREDR